MTVGPDFENVMNTSAFGGHVEWLAENPPRARPTIRQPDEVGQLRIPEVNEGFWAKYVRWWQDDDGPGQGDGGDLQRPTRPSGRPAAGRAMDRAAHGCHRSGRRRLLLVDAGVSGSLPSIVGHDYQRPHPCGNLLSPARPHTARPNFAVAEDSAQIMSAELFREFCVPYDNRLFDAFGSGMRDGRGMHMCGKSDHLHATLLEEERITSFQLFGHNVKPAVAARNLGGKCCLWGNLDPVLLLEGPKEKIREATVEFLEALGPCRGVVLGDGANVCPGTPLDHLAVLRDTAEQYARERPELFDSMGLTDQ